MGNVSLCYRPMVVFAFVFTWLNRESFFEMQENLRLIVAPVVSLVLPGAMLMMICSPPKPHHVHRHSDLMMVTDALTELQEKEFEEEEEEVVLLC